MVGFHRTFSMLLHLYKRLGVLAKHTPNRKKVKVSGQGLGALIPDAILLSGSTIKGVVDAKYKSLHPSASSPNGPQRDDLYQMAAYLGRFGVCQGSWNVRYATSNAFSVCVSSISFSGLSQTLPTGRQFRVLPDQRAR